MRTATACGFRTIRFDADKGFFLNDEPLKLKGVCNHQDHAGVGVAVPDSLWDFRVRKLKEMGANALLLRAQPARRRVPRRVRPAGPARHGRKTAISTRPPSTCARFQWLIRRDRNHPQRHPVERLQRGTRPRQRKLVTRWCGVWLPR